MAERRGEVDANKVSWPTKTAWHVDSVFLVLFLIYELIISESFKMPTALIMNG